MVVTIVGEDFDWLDLKEEGSLNLPLKVQQLRESLQPLFIPRMKEITHYYVRTMHEAQEGVYTRIRMVPLEEGRVRASYDVFSSQDSPNFITMESAKIQHARALEH
ncbi:hypothetical protein VNO77_44282 [Canavalia gladiata]|uniref:Uncharacterized protein n=1 Tax=Canavalia gladiata TaxID=3824 RepID=A0AAN9PQ78_CANGL